ncbi:MAG TPA: hypothetical protein VMV07_13275 [Streptosporangiaceae bacterium]|nr:hypothetical protein [Streptosporangiaceae bacterium]
MPAPRRPLRAGGTVGPLQADVFGGSLGAYETGLVTGCAPAAPC